MSKVIKTPTGAILASRILSITKGSTISEHISIQLIGIKQPTIIKCETRQECNDTLIKLVSDWEQAINKNE